MCIYSLLWQLLEHVYPGLLDTELSGQLVEIFVPFPFEGQGECEGEGEGGRRERGEDVDLVMSGEQRRGGGEGEEDDVFSEDMSPLLSKSPHGVNLSQVEKEGGGVIGGSLGRREGSEEEGKGKRVGAWPVVGSLPSNVSSGSSRQRLLVDQTTDTSSWEILSKHSSTSTRFSFKTVSDIIIG